MCRANSVALFRHSALQLKHSIISYHERRPRILLTFATPPCCRIAWMMCIPPWFRSCGRSPRYQVCPTMRRGSATNTMRLARRDITTIPACPSECGLVPGRVLCRSAPTLPPLGPDPESHPHAERNLFAVLQNSMGMRRYLPPELLTVCHRHSKSPTLLSTAPNAFDSTA